MSFHLSVYDSQNLNLSSTNVINVRIGWNFLGDTTSNSITILTRMKRNISLEPNQISKIISLDASCTKPATNVSSFIIEWYFLSLLSKIWLCTSWGFEGWHDRFLTLSHFTIHVSSICTNLSNKKNLSIFRSHSFKIFFNKTTYHGLMTNYSRIRREEDKTKKGFISRCHFITGLGKSL
jgi:hypothetical protein